MMLRFDSPKTFSDLLEDTLATDFVSAAKSFPTMHITENQSEYVVIAEMPGVKKDDIQISIDGNEVTISGETKKETEEKKGEEVIRSERYYGKVARSFTLPHEVDETKVVAKYADGVLNLTLPMKAKAASRKVVIN